MNVASLELSKQLYRLSDWWDTGLHYEPWATGFEVVERADNSLEVTNGYPAYHLGYLLRMMPAEMTVIKTGSGQFEARLWVSGERFKTSRDTSPEDAACKLAIELFKQGILKREDDASAEPAGDA